VLKLFRKVNFISSVVMGAIKKNDPEAIFKILASFKGPAVKFGQLIANVPGILPSNWQAAFLKLQNKVPSMRGNFVKKRMVAELGENWEAHFDSFDLNSYRFLSNNKVKTYLFF